MYVKVNNGIIERFPYSLDQFKRDFANVSFPASISNEILSSFDVFPVSESQKPETDRFAYAVKRSIPDQVDGVWTVLWDVVQKTQEQLDEETERQSDIVRDSRNGKLSSCDWTQIPDAPLTVEQRQAWQTYRQALRDITTQDGFPWNVVWPSRPE